MSFYREEAHFARRTSAHTSGSSIHHLKNQPPSPNSGKLSLVCDNKVARRNRRSSYLPDYDDDKYRKRRRSLRLSFLSYFTSWRPVERRRAAIMSLIFMLVVYMAIRPLIRSHNDNSNLSHSPRRDRSRSRHPAVELDSSARLAKFRARLRHRTVEAERPQVPLSAMVVGPHRHKVEQGKLYVNPESELHPIYQLIHDARKAWDEKVSRQSNTLKEAVAEYKRRHNRAPPKGFDRWWRYIW
jgi:hypothetical protein